MTSRPAAMAPVPRLWRRASGRQLQMGLDDIGADRLAYGYAITAHRAQGTTVEVAHVLDDRGGRGAAL